jgi:hypothetical protein
MVCRWFGTDNQSQFFLCVLSLTGKNVARFDVIFFWFSVWIVVGTHPGCILDLPDQKARGLLVLIALK